MLAHKNLLSNYIRSILLEGAQDFTIYFDMDGVLADFKGGTAQSPPVITANSELQRLAQQAVSSGKPDVMGMDEESQKEFFKGEQKDPHMKALKKAWTAATNAKFKAAGQEGFFLNLPVLPGAQDMVHLATSLTGKKPNVLTAPIASARAQCEAEKEEWIKNNFPGAFDKFFCTEVKQEHAAPNAILIDDRPKYVNPFRDAGGIAILHMDPNKTMEELKEIVQNAG